MSEAEFRASFPTASAATILTPEADGVAALLKAVRAPELDSHAEARAELKEHLLGPSDPPSLARFNAAAIALCAKADARRARMASRIELHPRPAHRGRGGRGDGAGPLGVERRGGLGLRVSA